MARAICLECANVQFWDAVRGSHLDDVRCETCGGALTAYSYAKHLEVERAVRVRIERERAAKDAAR